MAEEVFAKLVDEGPVNQDKLLKDDEILTEEDKQKPNNAIKCGTDGQAEQKPKKPCANCTCGLADQQSSEAKDSNGSQETTKASCGSCYLGDAFRCASCPYRGMPAFKPGEKVTIDLSSDNL